MNVALVGQNGQACPIQEGNPDLGEASNIGLPVPILGRVY